MAGESRTVADLHCHVTDAYDIVSKRTGNHFYGFGQPSERLAEKLVERCKDAAINLRCDALAGIINFDDERAQSILKDIRSIGADDFGEYELASEFSSAGYAALKNRSSGRMLGFIAGQEIATDIGHVLVVGNWENIRERKFDEVVKRAKGDYGALIFAPHTGSQNLLMKAFNAFANRQPNYAVSAEILERYSEYFDGEQGIDLGCSDSHTIAGMFGGYTAFDFDISKKKCGRPVVDEIRACLKTLDPANLIHGKASIAENMRHGFSVLLAHAGLKSGILKRKL